MSEPTVPPGPPSSQDPPPPPSGSGAPPSGSGTPPSGGAPPSGTGGPPPPPSGTGAPPPSGTGAPPPPAGGAQSPNRGLMIVLSYLGPFALIPLLLEKDDREVQWHAKHGLLLLGVWLALAILLTVVGLIIDSMGGFACATGCLMPAVWGVISLVILVIHVMCVVKGVNGERFIIPGITQYADKF